MSNSKLRQEDNCLNCGQKVHTRFCSHCGQENKEPYENFWGLLFHFVEDIFHYDGKLFSTIKVLFTKPGLLSAEYLNGKRTTYLHPIRFYLFTSAFFFLSLSYVFHPLETYVKKETPKANVKQEVGLLKVITAGMEKDKQANPLSYDDYLAQQAKLPVERRDSEFEKGLIFKFYELGKKYTTPDDLISALLETMLHKISTVLFIALPFLAFILFLLFIRKKKFFFMHHGIFVLHVATSFFLVLFLMELISLLSLATQVNWITQLTGWIIVAWFIYYFVCFKHFYQLTWLKSLLYYLIALFLQQLFLIFVFFGLVIFSLLSL